jgi:hypothetical protein
LTLRFGSRSSSGIQVPPPSTVFQTPPSAAPAYIVLGEVGSMTRALVRPPMLPGPSGFHASDPAAAAPAEGAIGETSSPEAVE